jgi:hypothetical protein
VDVLQEPMQMPLIAVPVILIFQDVISVKIAPGVMVVRMDFIWIYHNHQQDFASHAFQR